MLYTHFKKGFYRRPRDPWANLNLIQGAAGVSHQPGDHCIPGFKLGLQLGLDRILQGSELPLHTLNSIFVLARTLGFLRRWLLWNYLFANSNMREEWA